jgi:hypothetical protein
MVSSNSYGDNGDKTSLKNYGSTMDYRDGIERVFKRTTELRVWNMKRLAKEFLNTSSS